MNYAEFTECFKTLCLSFDLDFEKKRDRIDTYFHSKFGELSKYACMELIKRAKENLMVKSGFLPPIRELVNLYYSTAQYEQKAKSDMENYNQAACAVCDGIGFVSLEKDGYRYGGFCCTCKRGQAKNIQTKIGRELGFYTDYLKKGYKLLEGGVPF
jgi:hypothetical protein